MKLVKFEDPVLSPPATTEEETWWVEARKPVLLRIRREALIKSGAVVAIAAVNRLVKHPTTSVGMALLGLGIGAVAFYTLFWLFSRMASKQIEGEKKRQITGRRMHRAILAEPDPGE